MPRNLWSRRGYLRRGCREDLYQLAFKSWCDRCSQELLLEAAGLAFEHLWKSEDIQGMAGTGYMREG
jgi:hypothetical protein